MKRQPPWRDPTRQITCELCGGSYDPIQGVHGPTCEVRRTVEYMALQGWVLPAPGVASFYLKGHPTRRGPAKVANFAVIEGTYYRVEAVCIAEDKTILLPERLERLQALRTITTKEV